MGNNKLKMLLCCIISVIVCVSVIIVPAKANTIEILETTDGSYILQQKIEAENFKVKIQVDENVQAIYNARVMFGTEIENGDPNKLQPLTGYEDSNTFKYEVLDRNGNMKDTGVVYFSPINEDNSQGGYNFTNLQPGDEIIVYSVPQLDGPNADQKVVGKVDVSVTNTAPEIPEGEVPEGEIPEGEIPEGETPEGEIPEGETPEVEVPEVEAPKEENTEVVEKLEITKNVTTDTFETVVGNYTIKNILNKYNVFSFNDVEGTHIVGPIVAKNKAYRTSKYGESEIQVSPVIVADYTRGIPSYVDKIERVPKTANISKEDPATVVLNYGFEGATAVKPNLYINEKDNTVKNIGSEWYANYVMIDALGEYKNPNNYGQSPILQNDNFIDFARAQKTVESESQNSVNNPNNQVVTVDENGYVRLEAGGHYLIKDASNLQTVDIIFPEGFNPNKPTNGDKPYLDETIINISGNRLPTAKTADNKEYFIFPNILVNGEIFNGGQSTGEGYEYGYTNNIIWNLPNISTTADGNNRVTFNDSDVVGHIVASNAEFWNFRIDSNGIQRWKGGNLNGGAIVKSWHSGLTEVHMWPYTGEEIGAPIDPSNVDLNLKGTKVYENGDLAELFNFILDKDGEQVLDGVYNIPQTIQQNLDGIFEFAPITFTKEGTYYLRIKEDTTQHTQGVVYDKSEYKVEVVVNKDGENLTISSVKIFKDRDNEGNILEPAQEVGMNDIAFTNKKDTTEIPKVNFTINKTDSETNALLPGAVFDLYEANETGEVQGEPLIKDITTNENGTISIIDDRLQFDKLYVLVETKAPDGYVPGENIVFYIKGTEGLYPEIEGLVTMVNSGTITITNKMGDEVLPETGGNGTDTYILLGAFLMMTSVTTLIYRSKIKN